MDDSTDKLVGLIETVDRQDNMTLSVKALILLTARCVLSLMNDAEKQRRRAELDSRSPYSPYDLSAPRAARKRR